MPQAPGCLEQSLGVRVQGGDVIERFQIVKMLTQSAAAHPSITTTTRFIAA